MLHVARIKKWLTVITLVWSTATATAAAPAEFSVRALVQETFNNMPYYLEYLAQQGNSTLSLDPVEGELLQGLLNYLRDNSPMLDYSTPHEKFVLGVGESERIAMTRYGASARISINTALLAQKPYELDIPLTVQLLVHELGHKLNRREDQASIDSLATKIGAFFKAHTRVMPLTDGWGLHVVSLPMFWFYRPIPLWRYVSSRLRPNTSVFLKSEISGYKSVTDQIVQSLNRSGGDLWPTQAAGRAFTDEQIQLFGIDGLSGNEVTLLARHESRLQPEEEWRLRSEPELFQSVRSQTDLNLHFDSERGFLEPRVRPAKEQRFDEPMRTVFEEVSPREWRLTLPNVKPEKKIYLIVSTALGPVQLAPENVGDVTSFRLRLPEKGDAQFLDVQTILDDQKEVKFLDRDYWFSIPNEGASTEKPAARFMQVQVDTKWRNVKTKNEGDKNLLSGIYSRWGKVPFRIQLQTYQKTEQIRFVWNMTRLRNKASDLRQPFVFDPMSQRHLLARGEGSEYAHESVVYDEVFSADQIQQDDRTLTVLLDMRPRHISFPEYRTYLTQMSVFYNFQSQVRVDHVTGEDTGRRDLIDILLTDENFETTSLLNGRKVQTFVFNSGGLSPCEEFLKNRRYYSDVFN